MQVGAGFFPLALSLLLAGLGATIALLAPRQPAHQATAAAPDWRGWSCIIAGMAAFLALGYAFGLAPGTFACVLISSVGDRQTRPFAALILAACVTAIGVFVFSHLLQVPFPVLQWGPA